MHKQKDLVIGLGEIGKPLLKLLSKNRTIEGFDIDPKLMNLKRFKKLEYLETSFLHICIPFSSTFIQNVVSVYNKFKPKCIVIHSTIQPYTTRKLQKKLPIPIIYSATRGVHKRMSKDLKRYTKFYAIEEDAPNSKWAIKIFCKTLKECGIKSQRMSNPITLELAKILCDTSYLGWLVNYAQVTNAIAIQYGINYDEMWIFADEIHRFLGNRPKMYPGFIGGHCVIPNLDLMHNQTLNLIKKLNNTYKKSYHQKRTKKYFKN